MPVTLHPAKFDIAPIKSRAKATHSPHNLLSEGCYEEAKRCKEIFQSSFDTGELASIVPSDSGFVRAALLAYNQHHRLVIRPDDVWITILTQFNFFVNANAEKLRHLFVAHEGQKQLEVNAVGSRYTVDFGNMAQQMGELIEKEVLDPDLRKWIIPDFTTTTTNDRIVSSVIMMATLKKYFSYKFGLMCGIPAVTLLGEKEDWEKIVARLEKLKTFGEETTDWYNLLKPVLTRFVKSFDEPESDETKDFWQKIASYSGGGSGPTWLSGWIVAFCFFDAEGESLFAPGGKGDLDEDMFGRRTERLKLDGQLYHRIDSNDVPKGYAEVDVELDDNGQSFNTTMIAGLVGYTATGGSAGEGGGTEEGSKGKKGIQRFSGIFGRKANNVDAVKGPKHDTVQPVAGWWLFERQEVKDDGRM